MHAILNLFDRFLAMLNLRRGRKRKRVTMRYLMLLSLTVSAMPCLELIFKPIV
jgi:hypothetical protein